MSRRKKPTNQELWSAITRIAEELHNVRNRLSNMEGMFDLLLSYNGDSKEFMEYAEKKIEEYTNEASKVQNINKENNERSNADKGAGTEGVRTHAE